MLPETVTIWQPELPALTLSKKTGAVQLADLERMFYLLDGKTIPDNRHDVSNRFMDFVRDNPHQQIFEDELFTIRYFQKGSGHITFKRLDLVEKMNDIVAKHFPGMLPAK
ncbi:DUF4942 domain-containing protein [Martelella alba]|uniref:DUF4942 domain-containing protein n=1 Tax=Martelella alba TaxID=2590451 RepID=A0ABY2SEA7_9HYPH|nr:DUF4942 domain-containing protein [Martelella alba]TKI01992.1 DUF4942 domain-containing protein [Martelella alba]